MASLISVLCDRLSVSNTGRLDSLLLPLAAGEAEIFSCDHRHVFTETLKSIQEAYPISGGFLTRIDSHLLHITLLLKTSPFPLERKSSCAFDQN